MKPKEGFVQFDMVGENFFEICFGNAQGRAFAVGVGVMGAPVAIKNRDIAKPNAWLDIGQGDLFA